MADTWTIGMVAKRTGVAASALRYYEDEGLIRSTRTATGQRRYEREVVRRVSFVRVAQQMGLTLGEIREALAALPDQRTPTHDDWTQISAAWRPRIEERIAMLERLRDYLDGCIGCGCLSLELCKLVNPGDEVSDEGAGPRYVLSDTLERKIAAEAPGAFVIDGDNGG